LKRIWFNIKGENIPLYHIPKPAKDLNDFTTTEKDMNKKQSRHPTSDYRALSEDLFVINQPQTKVEAVTNQLGGLGMGAQEKEPQEQDFES